MSEKLWNGQDQREGREEAFPQSYKETGEKKAVKYQFCDDETSWTLDFALKLKGQIGELSGS